MKIKKIDRRTTVFQVEKPVNKKSTKQGNKAPDKNSIENQEA